jgi:HlyD family secretion protein
VCGCGRRDPQATESAAPLPSLQVVTVQRGALWRTLPATGTLSTLPNMEAILVPQVPGTLRELPVRFGEHVQGGQIVAQISPTQLLGQLQQATATYRQNLVEVDQAQANALQQKAQTQTAILQAKANFRNSQAAYAAANAVLTGLKAAEENARQNLQREQSLFNDGLVSKRDLESVVLNEQTSSSQVDAQKQTVEAQRETVAGEEAALAAAKAGSIQDQVKQKDIQIARQQVENAMGVMSSARAQLALCTIRSPLAGDVTAIGAAIGESVDSTTKLVTVSNLDRLQLTIAAPSASARIIHPGDDILFTTESLPGRQFRATVETVSPQIDPTNGSVAVLATIPNPGHLLKDDMTVSAQIVTARRDNALMVPQSAVLSDPDTGEKSVTTVGSDSVAHIVTVTTGIEDGGYVEVLSGLAQGRTVSISGQYGIPDGAKVKAVRSAAPPRGDGAGQVAADSGVSSPSASTGDRSDGS